MQIIRNIRMYRPSWIFSGKGSYFPLKKRHVISALLLGMLALLIHTNTELVFDESPGTCSVPSLKWEQSKKAYPSGISALYTPYPMVPGGGERYLLTFAAAMQRTGLHVHLLVERDNPVQNSNSLLIMASKMSIIIEPIDVYTVRRESGQIQGYFTEVDIFFVLGNEKLPQISGIGYVNLYMCQFPFDLGNPAKEYEIENFITYDYVLLNSKFSFGWYNRYLLQSLNLTEILPTIPDIQILYPPVPTSKSKNLEKNSMGHATIVLLGRFFEGRQSKGHAEAINMFHKLSLMFKRPLRLVLAGSQMRARQEDIEYTAKLKTMSTKAVQFLIDYKNEDLESLLTSADIIWHLTGIGKSHTDPASEEHFGISVALAMSYGVVPVVFKGGAMAEIVDHGRSGYLCEAEICFITKTLFLLEFEDIRKKMARIAMSTAEKFSVESFVSSAETLLHRGRLSKPFRYLIKETSSVVLKRNFVVNKKRSKEVLLIEPRNHYALEYCLKNALYHLGPSWSLTLVHGMLNAGIARHLQYSIKNTRLMQLQIESMDIKYLNKLLTSKKFWMQFKGTNSILIIQTDGLLLGGDFSKYLKYDYIGAPWHKENERWGKLAETIPEGVGNGGMSLRSPKAILRILSQYEASGQEDLFYIIKMVGNSDFTLPDRQTAYEFAREVKCSDLNSSELPLMMHAIWYYDEGESLYRLLEKSIC